VEQELVSSDIRINCAVATDQLYEFVIQGQDVSRSTGKSELIASQIVTYYVE
jgi:hypothetical protein